MTGREDLFQQAMNLGHSAAWDQAWERAATYYRQALEFIPAHPRALSSLGLALIELQNYDEALKVYLQAAKLSPNDPLPLEKVAQLFERAGHLDRASTAAMQAADLYLKNRDVNKAIENWQRVLRLKPESLAPHARLALVYERMGNKDQAVTEYLALASLYQKAKDYQKATSAVQHALNLAPDSETARRSLTLIQDYKPLPPPPRPRGGTSPLFISKVKQLKPGESLPWDESSPDPIGEARQKALTVLAGMLFEQAEESGDERPAAPPSGRRPLGAMLKGMGGSRSVDRARILLHLSQVIDSQTHEEYAQAAEELERAVEAGLDHPAAYFDLGLLETQTGQPEAAVRNLQKAAGHPDFSLAARILLGQSLRAIGRVKEASVFFLEALGLADSEVVPALQADDLRQLYEPLIEAQRQQPETPADARLCENIAGLLLHPNWRSHLTQARQQLPSQAVDGPPIPLAEMMLEARSSQAVEAISRVYRLDHAGQLNSAMEEAFFALQYAPTYLPLHTYIGELLLKKGQVNAAAVKLMQVAHTYGIRGENGRALELCRRIVEINPVEVAPRLRLIEQLVALGKSEEAVQMYLDVADVYYSLADLEMVRQTFTQAYRLAQKANVDRLLKINILHRLADLNLQSLDWRQALRVFEQIRTLQPEDEDARANLVVLNFKLGQESQALTELDNYITFLIGSGKREKAVEFLENLVREDENRVGLRRRLAELYLQIGQYGQAIAQYDAIGELLLDAGDRAGAVQVVERILKLNPPNAEEYQHLLAQIRSS
jgi:tetratricopeptide (TPR) repeat protein